MEVVGFDYMYDMNYFDTPYIMFKSFWIAWKHIIIEDVVSRYMGGAQRRPEARESVRLQQRIIAVGLEDC